MVLPKNQSTIFKKVGLCTIHYNCGIETESTLHHLCECAISSTIWQQVVHWLNTQGQHIVYLTDRQILFGDKGWDPVVNQIIINPENNL